MIFYHLLFQMIGLIIMQQLNNYIIEKLKINKDSKLNNKYILFYRFDRTDTGYKILDSLNGIINYMDTLSGKLGSHYVFCGNQESIKDLIINWIGRDLDNIEQIRDFCKDNEIKELTANDINNARINAKNK